MSNVNDVFICINHGHHHHRPPHGRPWDHHHHHWNWGQQCWGVWRPRK